MAKKKSKPLKKKASPAKAAKKKPVKSKSASHRGSPKVHTEFVAAFVAEFIGGPKPVGWKWPLEDQPALSVYQQFQTFVNALVEAGYLDTPPAAGTGNPLLDRIENFLIAQQWPLSAPIPKRWQGIQPTIRLIEISQITDHLLEAMNAVAQGLEAGSGSNWPPH